MQRRGELGLQPLRHEQERRRARPAIQIFVAAPHGHIGFAAVQIDLDRADAMTQIPDHQRAMLVSLGSDGSHVVNGGGLVVDMREHDHRGVRIDRVDDALGWLEPQL